MLAGHNELSQVPEASLAVLRNHRRQPLRGIAPIRLYGGLRRSGIA
jgi:hypothetical protein